MEEQYLGTIQMVAFTFTPANFAFCDGALVGNAQNPALFSLICEYFGGDGISTFGLPDLRAHTPVGSNMVGAAPGLACNFPLGFKAGAQTQTPSQSQMPEQSQLAAFTPNDSNPASGELSVCKSGGLTDTPATGSFISGGGWIDNFRRRRLRHNTGGTVTVDNTGAGEAFEKPAASTPACLSRCWRWTP